MRRGWLLVLVAVAGAAPLRGHESAVLERNRRLLADWRALPGEDQFLKEEMRAFWARPKGRREAIRRLDRRLHELPLEQQERLWAVLGRYRRWLDRLPEADRRRVFSADGAARLALIRELREREWVEHLPRLERERVLALTDGQRRSEVALLRKAERDQRAAWLGTGQPSKAVLRPRGPEELSAPAREFVETQLLPQLSTPEKRELERAAGNWPDYPRAVLRLSQKHPVLPPLPSGEVVRWRQLPKAVQEAVGKRLWTKMLGKFPPFKFSGKKRPPLSKDEGKWRMSSDWNELKKREGQWPGYARTVAELLKGGHKKGRDLPPLGASRPGELPTQARRFAEEVLPMLLPEADLGELRGLEGRWPDYPLKLHELSRRHRFTVPGMTLPGPSEVWELAAQGETVPSRPAVGRGRRGKGRGEGRD